MDVSRQFVDYVPAPLLADWESPGVDPTSASGRRARAPKLPDSSTTGFLTPRGTSSSGGNVYGLSKPNKGMIMRNVSASYPYAGAMDRPSREQLN